MGTALDAQVGTFACALTVAVEALDGAVLPGPVAHALALPCDDVANAIARAVVRAHTASTICAHPVRVTAARAVVANTVSGAVVWTGHLRAVQPTPARIAQAADGGLANAIVAARVGAHLGGAVLASPALVALALSIFAHAVLRAVVQADLLGAVSS